MRRSWKTISGPWALCVHSLWASLPMGAPGDVAFDEHDNLIVQDHTWYRTWVIDLQEVDEEGSPVWLEPLRGQ